MLTFLIISLESLINETRFNKLLISTSFAEISTTFLFLISLFWSSMFSIALFKFLVNSFASFWLILIITVESVLTKSSAQKRSGNNG